MKLFNTVAESIEKFKRVRTSPWKNGDRPVWYSVNGFFWTYYLHHGLEV
jgi:hypothetical protein